VNFEADLAIACISGLAGEDISVLTPKNASKGIVDVLWTEYIIVFLYRRSKTRSLSRNRETPALSHGQVLEKKKDEICEETDLQPLPNPLQDSQLNTLLHFRTRPWV